MGSLHLGKTLYLQLKGYQGHLGIRRANAARAQPDELQSTQWKDSRWINELTLMIEQRKLKGTNTTTMRVGEMLRELKELPSCEVRRPNMPRCRFPRARASGSSWACAAPPPVIALAC